VQNTGGGIFCSIEKDEGRNVRLKSPNNAEFGKTGSWGWHALFQRGTRYGGGEGGYTLKTGIEGMRTEIERNSIFYGGYHRQSKLDRDQGRRLKEKGKKTRETESTHKEEKIDTKGLQITLDQIRGS